MINNAAFGLCKFSPANIHFSMSLLLLVDHTSYQVCFLWTSWVIACSLAILYSSPQFLKHIISPAALVGFPFRIIQENTPFVVCKYPVFLCAASAFFFISDFSVFVSYLFLFVAASFFKPALNVCLFLFS